MMASRPRITHGIILLVGMLLGFGLASTRVAPLRAGTSDRWVDRIVTSGPISIEENGHKVAIPQDAIYYLNYNTGILSAAIPSIEQTPSGTKMLTDWSDRDLLRDFSIKPGITPHFMMTTASMGARTQGWCPLFVFESETGQVAVYQVQQQALPGSTKPLFQLLERRTDRRFGKAPAPAQ